MTTTNSSVGKASSASTFNDSAALLLCVEIKEMGGASSAPSCLLLLASLPQKRSRTELLQQLVVLGLKSGLLNLLFCPAKKFADPFQYMLEHRHVLIREYAPGDRLGYHFNCTSHVGLNNNNNFRKPSCLVSLRPLTRHVSAAGNMCPQSLTRQAVTLSMRLKKSRTAVYAVTRLWYSVRPSVRRPRRVQ